MSSNELQNVVDQRAVCSFVMQQQHHPLPVPLLSNACLLNNLEQLSSVSSYQSTHSTALGSVSQSTSGASGTQVACSETTTIDGSDQGMSNKHSGQDLPVNQAAMLMMSLASNNNNAPFPRQLSNKSVPYLGQFDESGRDCQAVQLIDAGTGQPLDMSNSNSFLSFATNPDVDGCSIDPQLQLAPAQHIELTIPLSLLHSSTANLPASGTTTTTSHHHIHVTLCGDPNECSSTMEKSNFIVDSSIQLNEHTDSQV